MRRLRGGRVGIEDRAALPLGERRTHQKPVHRSSQVVARQHVGRVVGLGPQRSAGAVPRLDAAGFAHLPRQRLPAARRSRRRRRRHDGVRKNSSPRSSGSGATNVAAFIFEPVVGAAGGVVPAPDGYARLVREVCDRHGVLMIADEVMCGAGRCGTWRALEHDGVVPDIMPVAKGLGGGYVPLGATLYRRRIAEVLDAVSGGPMTGHTFTGHTLACAAGLAVQRIVERDGLVERVHRDGPALQQSLRDALGESMPSRSRWATSVAAASSSASSSSPTGDQRALRSVARTAPAHPPAVARSRTDLLPDGWQCRRDAWRHGHHRPAVQRLGRRPRSDRPAVRRLGAGRTGRSRPILSRRR